MATWAPTDFASWMRDISRRLGIIERRGAPSDPIGTSITGYWVLAPDGYLLENGAAVSRLVYGRLFEVIGTTFGVGDGVTTFNLPTQTSTTRRFAIKV